MIHRSRHVLRSTVTVFIVLLLAVGGAGCDSGGSNGDSKKTAQVRFMHASADAGPITVTANGSEVVSNLSFSPDLLNPTVTEYQDVPTEGTVEIQNESGDALATVDATGLEAEMKYMVVVAGGVAAGDGAGRDTPEALVLRDDRPELASDEVGLRVVHASVNLSESASPIDVFLVPPGDSVRAGTRVGSDVSFGETWPGSPSGAFEVRSFPDEGSNLTVPTPEGPLDVPIATQGRSVPTERSATYVIIDKAPGSKFPFAGALHVD